MNEPQAAATRVAAAHRRATIVIGAMTLSLVVYAVVVELINRSDTLVLREPPSQILRWVFYTVAVLMVFASHISRAFLLRGMQPDTVDGVLARLFTAHVVTAALAETPAVLGLVLFFVAHQYSDFYILAAISLYLLVRHFPRLEPWQRMVQQYGQKG